MEWSDIIEEVYFSNIISAFNSQISGVESDWTKIHEEGI